METITLPALARRLLKAAYEPRIIKRPRERREYAIGPWFDLLVLATCLILAVIHFTV